MRRRALPDVLAQRLGTPSSGDLGRMLSDAVERDDAARASAEVDRLMDFLAIVDLEAELG